MSDDIELVGNPTTNKYPRDHDRMSLGPLLVTLFLLVHSENRALWAGGVTTEEVHFRAIGFTGHQFHLSLKSDLSNPGYRTMVTKDIAHIHVCFFVAFSEFSGRWFALFNKIFLWLPYTTGERHIPDV